MVSLVGQTISHYSIQEHLGGGGMGVVYKAEDSRLKRSVALKFLPPELTRDPEAKERFVHEAQAASQLQHNNICAVHDIDEGPEGQIFIVMDFYEGETLKKRTGRGPLPIDEAVDIAVQVAQGLGRAHEQGIVHRDVKPANIMITRDGVVKIVDFGLAKLSGRTLLTKTGSTLGTIAYMSPEQALGSKVDLRTDIWSLGVVLYEMLTGRRPFASDVEEALVFAIRNDEPAPPRELRPEVPRDLENIVRKAMKKAPDARYSSMAAMVQSLKRYQEEVRRSASGLPRLRAIARRLTSMKVLIPALAVLCAAGGASYWYVQHQSKLRWAKDVLLAQALALKRFDEDMWENVEAYRLAEAAERYIPGDPALTDLFRRLSVRINISTEPAGARVFLKQYGTADSPWQDAGISPINDFRVPVWFYEFRMEKEGYEPVRGAILTAGYSRKGWTPDTVRRTLDARGQLPAGMVRVAGVANIEGIGTLDDFYMDRHEVTNKSFKEFVDNGGYRKKEYWRQHFVRDRKPVHWETAIREFVDQTGRPGPSTWQAGDFPEGQGNHPVSGVSWYEAAAFAEYSGKALPTVFHWDMARGKYTRLGESPFFSVLLLTPVSNLNAAGPVPVESSPGITAYGNFDMAGNVREWCWNSSQEGRITRGGAWNDVPYMAELVAQANPWDRSPTNGFRCARYLFPGKIPGKAFEPVHAKESRNFRRDAPASDALFETYREQFAYDRGPLEACVEWTRDSSAGWIHEKVSYNAAYENERVLAHLFLPRNQPPPYQTVVYFPAGYLSAMMKSSDDLEHYRDFTLNVRFLLQSGRAVLYPVYKGTFERGSDDLLAVHLGDTTRRYSALVVKIVKDFRRSLDYLETRPDIDATKLAFFGFCWGGYYGAIIPAVEKRLKVSVLEMGGFLNFSRPEVDEFNYVTRVTLPTLMLNGKYDTVFPLERSVRPMFALLGTPGADKRLVLYETAHFIPENERIKETLGWLDKYLGRVR